MFTATAFVTAVLENDWVTFCAGPDHPLIDGREFEAVSWDPNLPDGSYCLWMRYSVTKDGMIFQMVGDPSLQVKA